MKQYVWYSPKFNELFITFHSEDKGPLVINPWIDRSYLYYIGEL